MAQNDQFSMAFYTLQQIFMIHITSISLEIFKFHWFLTTS